MDTIPITTLRQELYHIIDRIIATGKPQGILRNGHKLKIILDDTNLSDTTPTDKFAKLYPHGSLIGNPEDLTDLKLYTWHENDKL